MIASFDELLSRCSNESSKSHIAEAIRCYESSAYRAAIVTTYIAVCFDLIEKLRSLASIGDKEAIAEIEKLGNRQSAVEKGQPDALRKLLDFERGLLETFRDKFSFFGKTEFEEISRLRSDRHRCAHPTYLNSSLPYSPNAELARLHIVNALNLVLVQSPRHGKAAIESISSVILSKYFPDTVEDALSRLKGTELVNARPVLVRSMIDALMFGWPDPQSQFHHKIAAVRSVLAIVEMDRREASPRVLENLVKLLRRTERDCIRLAAAIAVRLADIGEMIPASDQITLKVLVSDETLPERVNFLNRAVRITYLRKEAINQIRLVPSEELGNIISDPCREMVERAVELYSTSPNWPSSNSYTSSFMLKFCSSLTSSDLEIIAEAAKSGKADLIGSGGFKRFLSACYDEKQITEKEITEILKRHELDRYIKDRDANEDLN